MSEHTEDRMVSLCVQSEGSVIARVGGKVSSGPLAMFSETLFRSGSVKSQGVCRSNHVVFHQHRRVK